MHADGQRVFCWECRQSEMHRFGFAAVERRGFFKVVWSWAIWPLGDVSDRSASGITGGSVCSIGGVVGHFGGAGRLPVFVGDGESGDGGSEHHQERHLW